MAYEITEVLNDVVGKFVAMVSFNGNTPERYEVDSLDSNVIDETLTKVADDALQSVTVKEEQVATADAISVVEGKIVTE